MIGDQSEILQHLNTARKHADQAENDAKPELYREAIDELSVAIELLMRNTGEQEGPEYDGKDIDLPALDR